jgi:hypothetical protein
MTQVQTAPLSTYIKTGRSPGRPKNIEKVARTNENINEFFLLAVVANHHYREHNKEFYTAQPGITLMDWTDIEGRLTGISLMSRQRLSWSTLKTLLLS